jgi:hypothetical protein
VTTSVYFFFILLLSASQKKKPRPTRKRNKKIQTATATHYKRGEEFNNLPARVGSKKINHPAPF